MYICMCVCIYVCMYICMYICMCVCIMYVQMYVYMYVYMYKTVMYTCIGGTCTCHFAYLRPIFRFFTKFLLLASKLFNTNHNIIINLWTYYEIKLPHQTHHQNLLSRYIPHYHDHNILLPCLFELLLC